MRSWTVGFFWLGTIAFGFCSEDCSKIAGLSGCVDKCKFERQVNFVEFPFKSDFSLKILLLL